MQYFHLTESLAQFIGLQQEFRVARSFIESELRDGVGLVNEAAAGPERRQNSREELTTQKEKDHDQVVLFRSQIGTGSLTQIEHPGMNGHAGSLGLLAPQGCTDIRNIHEINPPPMPGKPHPMPSLPSAHIPPPSPPSALKKP